MFVLKNMFTRLLENKMAVVADYYEVKLMEDKKRRKEDDHSCRRIDPSAPSFVYNNDESASLPITSKEIQKNVDGNFRVYTRIPLSNVLGFLPRLLDFQV